MEIILFILFLINFALASYLFFNAQDSKKEKKYLTILIISCVCGMTVYILFIHKYITLLFEG